MCYLALADVVVEPATSSQWALARSTAVSTSSASMYPVANERVSDGAPWRDSRRGSDSALRSTAADPAVIRVPPACGRTEYRAGISDQPVGSPNLGVAEIPAGVGCKRHGDFRQTNSADLVAIRIDLRHKKRLNRAFTTHDGSSALDARRPGATMRGDWTPGMAGNARSCARRASDPRSVDDGSSAALRLTHPAIERDEQRPQ